MIPITKFGAMCLSLYKKMHTAAIAATRKAIPSSFWSLLLCNPFSRNVADAGSLNEFDAGHFSVCLFQDPLLYEDGQGFALEMTVQWTLAWSDSRAS